jgi:hypothetical protein
LKNHTHCLMFWPAFIFIFVVSWSDRMDCHIADACFPLRCCVCVCFLLCSFCMRSILPLDFCCTSWRWSAIKVTSLPFRSVQEFRIRASFTARNQDLWSWCWSYDRVLCLVSEFSIPLSRGSNLNPSSPESR